MIFTFLIVVCCFAIIQFFIVYCRSLAEFARIAISPGVMTDLSIKEDEASGDDFPRLAGLARLCQETEEVYRLHFVENRLRWLRLPLSRGRSLRQEKLRCVRTRPAIGRRR